MAVLPIRLYPDPVLREPAAPVEAVDADIGKLVADMLDTMHAAPGVGLAAPQIGVQRRVLVYQADEEEPERALINPVIIESSGNIIDDEGCLSIPGISFGVERAERIIVRALDAEGGRIEREAVDFEARVIQHEIDHLDGILFIERLTPELRKEAKRQIRELAAGGPPAVQSVRI